ncbi:SDR family oxidoreductase [Methylocella silvestris]|uniref:3-oxoacyl-ACP reductase n=1 Tax=Methylocella silvestris TaxID=199596 RepID=A0A2J7TM84_METSI|nr:SDR family oxidoreductase [Methylocella silvestris]PNG27889.1 3-oxoacyl-ACP reductase [Methylocella silvestris]
MSGKIVIVTGAGSGIGRAASLEFARRGDIVILAGRREEALTATRDLCADPQSVVVVPTDVTDEAAVSRLFDAAVGRFSRVDVLFNNAGSFAGAGRIDELTLEQWRAMIDVNLTGSFLCAQAAFRAMKSQDPCGGRIINNGSISAHAPRPRSIAYTASKHAITGLTKSISLDGRPWNIACGQIDIGNAATDMTGAIAMGALQANGDVAAEPTMEVRRAAEAVAFMADLPPGANVQFMTVMATNMPFIGRG